MKRNYLIDYAGKQYDQRPPINDVSTEARCRGCAGDENDVVCINMPPCNNDGVRSIFVEVTKPVDPPVHELKYTNPELRILELKDGELRLIENHSPKALKAYLLKFQEACDGSPRRVAVRVMQAHEYSKTIRLLNLFSNMQAQYKDTIAKIFAP
jgi:hypothetical protein